MFLKLPKYNSSLAPGFTNKELKDSISRQRKSTRFKQQFEEFWELAPRPLCFLSDPKLFRLVLKSRIFSLTADLIFQFFVGEAWGERRIIFWKFKENQNFVFLVCLHVCELLYIVSFVVKSPSGGAKVQEISYLRIQGRMQIFSFLQ